MSGFPLHGRIRPCLTQKCLSPRNPCCLPARAPRRAVDPSAAGIVRRLGRCRPFVLAASLATLLTLPAPSPGMELLTERQLDSLTAGTVTVRAVANALALGQAARTDTSVQSLALREKLIRVRLRRVNGDLVVPELVEEREVDIGFASATAAAFGQGPRVTCETDLDFSEPVSTFLTSKRSVSVPGRAVCGCARFGISVLPK